MKKSLVATAYHEAGHALASYILGFRIRRVSIIADDTSHGRMLSWRKARASWEFLEFGAPIFQDRNVAGKIARWHDEVVVYLTGGEAQRLVAPKAKIRIGMKGDLDASVEILLGLHPKNELPLVFKWLQMRARNIVASPVHRGMIKDLASALMNSREMTGRKAVALLRDSFDKQTMRGRQKVALNA